MNPLDLLCTVFRRRTGHGVWGEDGYFQVHDMEGVYLGVPEVVASHFGLTPSRRHDGVGFRPGLSVYWLFNVWDRTKGDCEAVAQVVECALAWGK